MVKCNCKPTPYYPCECRLTAVWDNLPWEEELK